MTPPIDPLAGLTEAELFTVDFNAWLLVSTRRTIFYAGRADLLTAGLARIGHPELTASETGLRLSIGDNAVIFVAIPTPATGPEERTKDDTTDPRPA